MYRTVAENAPAAPAPQALLRRLFPSKDVVAFMETFDALLESEALAILERFRDDNASVRERYGLVVPSATERSLRERGEQAWATIAKHRRLLDAALAAWGIRETPV